ncbi:MAG TPA: tetratricopeptide repeat protein, partial [Roseiarcus sp.]|nr:tetratricopeptide repeat protein [Roseiarcus sp.]
MSARCYRLLTDGVVDRVVAAIAVVISEKVGEGVDAFRAREDFERSGIIWGILGLLDNPGAVRLLTFQRGDYPLLKRADPGGQILAALINRMTAGIRSAVETESDAGSLTDDEGSQTPASDPLFAAAARARQNYDSNFGRSVRGSSEDLPAVQRELRWIGEKLESGETEAAERGLIQLIERQGARARPADIMKSLTTAGDLARKAGDLDFARRAFEAAGGLGLPPDAALENARAELLRELGRPEDALAAFDETIRLFPRDDVARNARGETLRELRRPEDALAAFDETIRLFPRNEVARTARGETLRELGRPEDALAAFDETIRLFPRNVVAR